jgi:hypothetical protein
LQITSKLVLYFFSNISIRNFEYLQIINPAYNQHQHYANSPQQQQQQHQSRYYEAHVQQQKQLQQQQRAATTTRPQQYAQYPASSSLAHSMSAAEVVNSSPTTIAHGHVVVGSPLRTSTPRGKFLSQRFVIDNLIL